MRLPIAVAIAALSTVSVSAQDTPAAAPPPKDACTPIAGLLAGSPNTATGRLFLRDRGRWEEAEYNWWTASYTLENYHGEQLAFIYAAPPAGSFRGRQFISIRTIAYNDSSTNFVNLRKRKARRGSAFTENQVVIGRYQNYHKDRKSSGILTVFHQWFDGSRSDDPSESRQAWAFNRATGDARRRVLGVSFVANESRTTCAPFWLGPNIAAPNDEDAAALGYDQAGLGPFTIEISEAKIGTGSSGRTFTIHSEPQKN
jgi:hypothetical protein